MSRGVSNIIVEDCIFSGTDIGVRFKSAMGRGGVVEDITIKNIYMSNIIEEAMIFTMGYVLVNIEDANEGKNEQFDKEDIPEFKNIHLENIICNNSNTAIKINGLELLPIHDITIKNSSFYANKSLDLKLCKNIILDNVEITTKEKRALYKNEVFSA